MSIMVQLLKRILVFLRFLPIIKCPYCDWGANKDYWGEWEECQMCNFIFEHKQKGIIGKMADDLEVQGRISPLLYFKLKCCGDIYVSWSNIIKCKLGKHQWDVSDDFCWYCGKQKPIKNTDKGLNNE